MPWNPRVIIITCPRLPREEFTQRKLELTDYGMKNMGEEALEDVGQLVRRCR